MSRILNDQGHYAPEQPVPGTAPESVDAGSLPQKQPDPYENVNAYDFSTASSMSVRQLLKMADVASSQGIPGVAMQWKQMAVERGRAEMIKADAERLPRMWEVHPMPPAGQILERESAVPWAGDAEHRCLTAEYEAAKKVSDASTIKDPDLTEKRAAVADAHDAMVARQEEVKAEYAESGLWTEMNDRQAAAQQSLAGKAAKVAGAVKRSR